MKWGLNTKRIARRDWSRLTVLTGAAAICASPSGSAVFILQKPARKTRGLWMQSIHSGEVINTAHWRNGRYISGALNEIDWFMRDWRSDEYSRMDLAAFELWSALHQTLGFDYPQELISGYRSPKTNTLLRARSAGVAKNSLHMHGRAADIRLRCKSAVDIARAAISIGAGSIGHYPKSDFVHVDIGPRRSREGWRG